MAFETGKGTAFPAPDFLLKNETAKYLFHQVADKLPIIDYHCHLSPKEIFEDVAYENITKLWLGGDHYKWRQMRSNGVPEEYITGNASDHDKFIKWAETLEKAIGNPLYHWSHLELQRYFGFEGHLGADNAEDVWEFCNAKLKKENLSARALIRMSNVEVICTTDDPIDSLEWHKALKETFEVKVFPAWRPDKACYIEKPDFADYIAKLSEVSGISIVSFAGLLEALRIRMDFFASMGCTVSDHGLEFVMNRDASREEIEAIFAKKLSGEELTTEEELQYKTAFLTEMGREYAKRGWVMQLHYGVIRDLNGSIYRAVGADAGIDAISTYSSSKELGGFLNRLAITDELPKTILYSLNPSENAAIGTVMGCFQDSSAVGKIQHGSAWWFNDNKAGMEAQMISLSSLGLLGNFVGMLTDSRSFLSYTRHEYFRRILCNLIGTWVEDGEFPNDEALLKKLVSDISYHNAKRYFGF